jgi:hypothetical protein
MVHEAGMRGVELNGVHAVLPGLHGDTIAGLLILVHSGDAHK